MTGEFSDIQFICQKETVKVHKFVLSKNDHIKNMLKDKKELELPSFIEKKGLDVFLLFCYNILPLITENNLTEAYIASLYFKVPELSDYILQFTKELLPKSKLFYSSISKLEDYLRSEYGRFTKDPLKNNLMSLFAANYETLLKDPIIKQISSLETDLKMEMLTSFKENLLKIDFSFQGFNFSENDFPDMKIISSNKKEFPCHSALISLWSEKLLKELKDSTIILEKYEEKAVELLIDLIYKNQSSDDFDFQSLVKEYEVSTKKKYFETSSPQLEFTYESDFDTNGILYYIATDSGMQEYVNPYESGKIKIEAQSGYYNITGQSCDSRNNLRDVVQREEDKVKSTVCCSSTGSGANYFIIDLGEDISVYTTHVTLACAYSPNSYLNTFEYQGSNDGITWATIAVVTSNSSVICNFDTKDDNNDYFRFFKVQSKNTSQLLMGGWEFYGRIQK